MPLVLLLINSSSVKKYGRSFTAHLCCSFSFLSADWTTSTFLGVTQVLMRSHRRTTHLMCEVEAIINGRPITKISHDPKDCEALTRNRLLLLRSGPILPPTALVKEDQYSNRWRQVQYLADVFWRCWLCKYLPSLQQRKKWNTPMRNFAVGDIVLVVDEKSPRGS